MIPKQHPFRFNAARWALLTSLFLTFGCNLGPIEDLPSTNRITGDNRLDSEALAGGEPLDFSDGNDELPDGTNAGEVDESDGLGGDAALGEGGAAGAASR